MWKYSKYSEYDTEYITFLGMYGYIFKSILPNTGCMCEIIDVF